MADIKVVGKTASGGVIVERNGKKETLPPTSPELSMSTQTSTPTPAPSGSSNPLAEQMLTTAQQKGLIVSAPVIFKPTTSGGLEAVITKNGGNGRATTTDVELAVKAGKELAEQDIERVKQGKAPFSPVLYTREEAMRRGVEAWEVARPFGWKEVSRRETKEGIEITREPQFFFIGKDVERFEAAEKAYKKASPVEQIGLGLATLLSPRGHDILGAKEIKKGTEEAIIKRMVEVSKMKGEWKDTIFGKQWVSEEAQAGVLESPVFELETTFVGAKGLSAAAKLGKSLGESAAGRLGLAVGKGTMIGAGVGMGAARTIEIKKAYEKGEEARGRGLVLTSIGDIAIGLKAYKPPVKTIPTEEIGLSFSRSKTNVFEFNEKLFFAEAKSSLKGKIGKNIEIIGDIPTRGRGVVSEKFGTFTESISEPDIWIKKQSPFQKILGYEKWEKIPVEKQKSLGRAMRMGESRLFKLEAVTKQKGKMVSQTKGGAEATLLSPEGEVLEYKYGVIEKGFFNPLKSKFSWNVAGAKPRGMQLGTGYISYYGKKGGIGWQRPSKPSGGIIKTKPFDETLSNINVKGLLGLEEKAIVVQKGVGMGLQQDIAEKLVSKQITGMKWVEKGGRRTGVLGIGLTSKQEKIRIPSSKTLFKQKQPDIFKVGLITPTKETQKQFIGITPTSIFKQVQGQKTTQIFGTTTKTPSLNVPTITTKIPSFPFIGFPIGGQLPEGGLFEKGKRRKRKIKRQIKYTPSLVGIFGKGKWKMPKVSTGIEVRPVRLTRRKR